MIARIGFVTGLLAATLVAACSGPGGGGDRLRVVVSLYPLEFFATRIGGDRVEVTNLVTPGVEAHDFEPTAGDLRAIARADVLIYNGLGLEPWIDRALASTAGADVVVDAGGAIDPIAVRGRDGEPGEGLDPHVWLDLRLAARQAEAIRDGLKRADPDHSPQYDRDAASLLAAMAALDLSYVSMLEGCRFHHFVTAHAAFGYLAGRYGLTQIEVAGVSQEEPDPAQLARIVDAVRRTGVRFVLTEPAASPRIAETLAREVGATALTLDPLESRPQGAEDYITAMERNRQVLRQALECNE